MMFTPIQNDQYIHVCEILKAMGIAYESLYGHDFHPKGYDFWWVRVGIFGCTFFVHIVPDGTLWWSSGEERARVITINELAGEIRSLRSRI